MSSDSSDRDFLARLKAQSAALAESIAIDQERKARIDDTIASYERGGARKPRRKQKRESASAHVILPAIQPKTINATFRGLSLQEAARKQLHLVGEPQTAQEIWPVLEEAGFVSASERPSNAVHWALRKREKTHKDVMLVGKGQWGLTDWYTEEERKEITKNLGGMAGRNHKSHSEKTKLGMELSRQRGVRIGAKIKITEEVIDRLRAHMAGGYSAKEACAMEKISYQSFLMLRKRPGMTGLDKLKGEARRRAIARRTAGEPASESPDLLTPRNGSMH